MAVWHLVFKTNEAGSITEGIGAREETPQDRLFGNVEPFPVIYPPPEVLQSLQRLIEQAQREDQD